MTASGGPGGDRSKTSPAAYLGLGFELVVPILAGFFVGLWLDGRWGSRPWLTVTGALLGIAAGFLNFFRRVLPSRGGGGGAR